MIALRNISSFIRSEKFWVAGDQALVSGTAFLTTLLVARVISPEEFGWFASVNLLQLFLLAVQNAVVTSPFQVEQARYSLTRREAYAQVVGVFQLLAVIIVVSLSGIVYMIHPDSLSSLYPIWWSSTGLVAGFLTLDTLRRIFLATGAAEKAFWIDAISNLLQLTGILVAFTQNHLTLSSAIWIMGLTYLPAIALGAYWLKGGSMNRTSFFMALRNHYQQGKWLLLTSLLQWWAGNYFIVAAGVLLGAASFGALRLAQYILGLLNLVLQAMENYLLPEAARRYEKSPALLSSYLRQQAYRTIWVMAPVALAMTLFPETLFQWAGGDAYTSFAYLLPAFAFLYLFIFAGYPVRICIRVMKLNREFFMGYLISAAFGAIAAYPIIEKWGAIGVVVGLITNQLLLIAYWLWILQRKKYFIWK